MSRHTMGQDWGGRRRENPENCPKVSQKDVITLAQALNIKVFRGGFFANGEAYNEPHGTWWYKDYQGTWRTLGTTNYLAVMHLNGLKAEIDNNHMQPSISTGLHV